MNRLLLYVHFNKYEQLSDHVIYQLQALRPLFNRIVFLSNSYMDSSLSEPLIHNHLIDDFVQRENEGFDFAAWQEGMASIGFDNLSQFDSVTLMNDTCFGPLWDLEPIFNQFDLDSDVDFWGMTNHRATSQHKEHLQSYFQTFKKPLLSSDVFLDFWKQVESHQDVQLVIDLFETGLTNILTEAGYQYKAFFDTLDADVSNMVHPDFTFYNPTEIINRRVPFLKVKAIEGNQNTIAYLLEEIEHISNYPVSLIRQHMSMMFRPDANYLLKYKYGSFESNIPYQTSRKVAIHLHVFYTDLLDDFLSTFKTFPFKFDLYITTDIQEKTALVEQVLKAYDLTATVRVTGNRGRDILPMLKLKADLSRYDYIGHFHTKKSKEAEFWAGESWRNELIDMLVKPSPAILERFDSDHQLGLVIADIPTYFRYVQLDPFYENALSEDMNALWDKMNLVKEKDFSAYSNYVMSYGTYIWFRYDALKPLFDLDLTDDHVPKEPLPQKSILHAIERLLVYISWAKGYDFYISQNPNLLPPFVEVASLNTVQKTVVTPFTKPDFTYFGGLKGALRYFLFANGTVIGYLLKRLIKGRF